MTHIFFILASQKLDDLGRVDDLTWERLRKGLKSISHPTKMAKVYNLFSLEAILTIFWVLVGLDRKMRH